MKRKFKKEVDKKETKFINPMRHAKRPIVSILFPKNMLKLEKTINK